MTKHIWESRQTKYRAGQIWEGFQTALKAGLSVPVAAQFGTYYAESMAQGSHRWTKDPETGSSSAVYGPQRLSENLRAAIDGGCRFARGKNGANYLLGFTRYWSYWVPLLASEVGLSPDTPWWALKDKLEELEKTQLLTALELCAYANGQME